MPVVRVAGIQGDTMGSSLSLGTTGVLDTKRQHLSPPRSYICTTCLYANFLPGYAGSDLDRILEIYKEELRVMEVLGVPPPPNPLTQEPPRVLLNSRPTL